MNDNRQTEYGFKIGGFSPKTAIAMNLIPLLDALGWKGSNTDLIEALVDQPDEMNLEDLLKTMANLRFEGVICRRAQRRACLKLPCLCVSLSNVFTLTTQSPDGYQAYDGSRCEYVLLKELPRHRKMVTFSPLEESRYSFLKPQKDWLGQVLQRFRKEFTYTASLSLLMTLFSLATPFFVMLMISQMQSADNAKTLLYLGAAVSIFIIGINGFKGLRSLLLIQLSERLGNIISNEAFRRLLYLSPQYTEIASVQQQINRIRDFETIKSFFSGSAFTSLIDAPLSLVLLVGLIFIAGPLAFIPFAAIIIFAALAVYYYQAYQRISARGGVTKTGKSQLETEMLTKLSTIRTSGHSNIWFKRYAAASMESLLHSNRETVYLNKINVFAKGISSITLVVYISFAALRVMNGEMSGGALFASFLLVSRLLSPIGSGFMVFSQFSKYQKSVKQLNRLMALPIEMRPKTIISLHKQMEGDIIFKNVFLKYGKETAPALMNLSFQVTKHETLAIVGHGSSGKSSILKLLLGMYSPLSGSILIDNLNLKQIDLIRLRKSISYIPSRSFIFSGTLLSNLYLSRPDASERKIREALITVGLFDLIESLPEQLNITIEDLPPEVNQPWFFKLLNFAQALLRESPICLIDELENGLPQEHLINLTTALKEMKKTTTILLVTMDPLLIKAADNMLWLDNGRIFQHGQSDKLKDRFIKGEYS